MIILNQIDTEAMPSKVLNIQDVEENLKAQKIATAIIVAQQQLDNETDQVMKESEESISARASMIVAESIHQNSSLALQKQQLINDKIRALRISTDIKGKIRKEISYLHADNDEKNKLFEERVKVVRGMIREILEKIQDGTIPNLTGQSPVPNIISFLEPTTTFEEILTKLNSVGNDKGTALFAQRVARKDIGTTDQIPLSAVTIDTIDDNDILIRSASVKSTPPFGSILTKTVEVQSLVASTKSGFVAKALPENPNQSTVILKAFIMDGTDRKAGYASFTILSSNVKKLEELQEKGYSFWSINNNFFAIPLDPSLHVKSLSQNKQALSGQIVTNINIVIKGNRPVTD